MLPACNRGAGANIHSPDVCLTPPIPVPVPYVDTGFNSMSVAFVPTVFLNGLPAHNLLTVIPVTTGDEPGSAHWSIKGFSKYIVGNPTVFVGKAPGVNLTCATIGNAGNAASGMCAVPSAVTTFYTFEKEQADLHPADMQELLPRGGAGASLVEETWDEAAGALHLRIAKIGADVPLVVRRALARHQPRTVTLDLRGNPGGDLDAAVRLVELFVPAATTVAVLVGREGTRRVLRTVLAAAFEGELRLEVDGTTASAAEVVAAALAQDERAVVCGTRTFGKGTAQAFTPKGYRTVAWVEGPEGPIERVGFVPQHVEGAER